ncbi:MAG: hypothetical protein N2Z80_06075 [Hydrogenothermaceae bacterium]|nr:hypothetical protein [Hydrogenothermaceae bacterium]
MNTTERVLYWIGIIVLIVAIIGTSKQTSELEKKESSTSATQTGGNQ